MVLHIQKLDQEPNGVSVICNVRNGEDNIEMCLSQVAKIADEILIIDQDSTDSTLEICKSFLENFNGNTYLEKKEATNWKEH